jgi:hypothetical protein
MDPLEFIRESALYVRSTFGFERLIAKKGDVTPQMLQSLANERKIQRPYQSGLFLNGAGYFLRHDDRLENSSQKREASAAPILWRLGEGPFAQSFMSRDESSLRKKRIVIEYWYHVGYNWATRVGIGNHQGDWEGMSELIELDLKIGHLEHRLLAAFLAEHETGTWVCAESLSYVERESHPEAFSATGTHATYATSGDHRSAILVDETERGWSWDTWHHLRPLALEPYYGYPGAWGEPRYFSFMTGPLVPGPGSKWLPRDSKSQAYRTQLLLKSKCHI